VLVVRPSSLGDIVHALPIVHDMHAQLTDVAIDWVAEEAFVPLVAMNHGVDTIIPIALRRWRHCLSSAGTWREMAHFRRSLRARRYDAVVDLQEQVKGALVAWLARGPVHGPDRASVREPVVTLAYHRTHAVDPQQHLIDRCRQLAGKALGYLPSGPPVFDLSPPALDEPPAQPYVVLVHSTSRTDKLWPEDNWRGLIDHFVRSDRAVLLPWGSAEEQARSRRLASGFPTAQVPPRADLARVAVLLRGAALACGVDTGLVHLAAALGMPTIALFTVTDPALAGVAAASSRAIDLGGNGSVPMVRDVVGAAQSLLETGAGPQDSAPLR
jgi:heptosyltransferase-1